MKKLYAILGLMLFLGACSKSQEELIPSVKFGKDNPRITVSDDGRSAEVTVLPAGELLTIGLESNVELTAKSIEDWCIPAIKEGKLALTVNPYETDVDRTAQVDLVYQGTIMAKIKVIQSGAATLEVEVGNPVTFPSGGGSDTFTVKTNQSVWNVTAPDAWVTIVKGDGEFTLTVPRNDKGGERKTTLTVVAGEGGNTAKQTFDVIQNDESFVMEITLPDAGCEMYLPVAWEVDCTIDWGDGSAVETVKKFVNPMSDRAPSHTYEKAGVYKMTISGSVEQFDTGVFSLTDTQRTYITRILRWGKLSLKSMKQAFYGCDKLVSMPGNTDDSFPEVTSFQSAFELCESLREIPEDLFVDCDKLTSIRSCFASCFALKTIPEKLFEPISYLTEMVSIFGYCKSLTNIPAGLLVPMKGVTTFENLFVGCESLPSVPAGLFDANTEVKNFASCFYNCKALRSLPDRLFSKNTKAEKFTSLCVFAGLESLPENLFEGCTEALDFQYAFGSCANLKQIPAGLFRTNTKVTKFWGVFKATGITTIPEGIFAACPDVATFQYLFWQCPNLKSVPANLFAKNTKATSFYGVFRECPALEALPEGLFAANTAATDFTSLCEQCTSLKTLPAGIFDNNRRVIKFGGAFRNCTLLTGESPYTTVGGVKVHLYERLNYLDQFTKPTSFSGAFAGCTQLSDWAAIEAAKWK